MVVQWLRLRVSTAGGVGSIPGQGTKIPHIAGWTETLAGYSPWGRKESNTTERPTRSDS